MPKIRLSKEPEERFKIEANPALTNDPRVDPKLFIDIKRANKVPSIPGGQSCPDKIRNGINLQFMKNTRISKDDGSSINSSISDTWSGLRMPACNDIGRQLNG